MAEPLRASLLITANADAAVAAMRGLMDSVGKLGGAASAMSGQAQAGAAGLGEMQAAAEAAASEIATVAAAETGLVNLADQLAPALASVAAGHDAAVAALAAQIPATQALAVAEESLAQGSLATATMVDALKASIAEIGATALGADQATQSMASELAALGAAATEAASETERVAGAEARLAAQTLRLTPALQALANVEALGQAAAQAQTAAIEGLIAAQGSLADATQVAMRAGLQQQAAMEALRARFDPLFAASRQYELVLEEIAEAERQGAISAAVAGQARERAAQMLSPALQSIGTQARGAGAAVTQLGYQVNDIAMMMAAGQNPFMLAMQQGTQVAQVFGDMRRQGQAIGPAIKGSLMALVDPMALVTMGGIALGAYVVQAFMRSTEAAKSFGDQLHDLDATMASLKEHSKLSLGEGLTERFGSMKGQVQELTTMLATLDRAAELKGLRDTLDQRFSEEIGPSRAPGLGLGVAQRYGQVAAHTNVLKDNFDALGTSMSYDAFVKMRAEMDQAASDGKIDAVSEKFIALGKAMAGSGKVSDLGAEAKTLLYDLGKVALSAAETEAAFNGSGKTEAGKAQADQIIAASARENELARTRLQYGEQSVQTRALEAEQARAALETEIARLRIATDGDQAVRMRADLEERLTIAADARTAAQRTAGAQMLAQYQVEANIGQLTARFGADSLEVAYARATAEREVVAAQLEAQGITGTLADNILHAWDAARGIAAVNIAKGIGDAAGQAQLLADWLGVSLDNAVGLLNLPKSDLSPVARAKVGFGGDMPALDAGLGAGGVKLGFGDNPGENNPDPASPKHRGGAGGAKKATDEVKALTDKTREQAEQLRIFNPLQLEMAKNYDVLAKATPKARAQLEGWISDSMQLAKVRSVVDDLGQSIGSAFVGLATHTANLGDAITSVLSKLADLAASSLWDQIWNGAAGTKSNGLGGMLMNWLSGSAGATPVQANADGGQIRGPGGPREDAILSWLSNGEYVVNAAATARALPLLEAINAGVPVGRLVDMIGGRRPAFADGGLVATGSSAPDWMRMASASGRANDAAWGAGAGGSNRPWVQISNYSSEPLQARQDRGPDGEAMLRLTVGRQLATGAYDSQHRARYGVAPEVAKR